jgi:hypothetical protein
MKKTAIILVIIAYFLCVIQAYISMYEYKDIQIPSFASSYLGDIVSFSLIIICPMFIPLYFPLFYLLFKKVNAKYKSIILPVLLSVMFMVSCFSVNNSIFTERVTAWSTYTITEELYDTLLHSYITIPIATAIFYWLNRKLLIFK